MKNSFKNLSVLFSVFLIFSCSAKINSGQYRGYETAEYDIINKSQNIEVRKYKKYLVAEIEVEGNRKEAAKKGFWALAKYIFGDNIVQEKIAMTSPVSQTNLTKDELKNNKSEKIAMTSPVSQIPNQNKVEDLKQTKKWLVQFKMPKKYDLKTLPKPVNQDIKFKEVNSKQAVAIIFSGLWSDCKFSTNKAKLEKYSSQNNLKLVGQPVISYYDDPFTLPWNRRNEIIWEVKSN